VIRPFGVRLTREFASYIYLHQNSTFNRSNATCSITMPRKMKKSTILLPFSTMWPPVPARQPYFLTEFLLNSQTPCVSFSLLEACHVGYTNTSNIIVYLWKHGVAMQAWFASVTPVVKSINEYVPKHINLDIQFMYCNQNDHYFHKIRSRELQKYVTWGASQLSLFAKYI
jgi:hypothetical protein